MSDPGDQPLHAHVTPAGRGEEVLVLHHCPMQETPVCLANVRDHFVFAHA